MSAGTLRQLTIQHLRGSVTPFSLHFEKGKKLTVIYGENGTGKSTICDALEFLGKGKVGSLENRGLGKTSPYWPSVAKHPSDVMVCLETSTATCRATIHKSEVVVMPPEERPRVEVLRRSQILSLVEAKAADRYAAISRYIDVSGIESAETALRDLIRDLNHNREVAVARVQENRDTIQQFWETVGKPGRDPLAWAESESSRDAHAYDAELSALDKLQTAYERLAACPAHLQAAEDAVAATRMAVAAAERALEQSVQLVAQDAGEMVDLLEAAQKYLTTHPAVSVCPVCESSESMAGLAQRIANRISSLTAVRTARSQQVTAGQQVQRAERELANQRENARQAVANFTQLCHQSGWVSDISLPKTPIPDDLSALSSWLAENAHLPATWKQAEEVRQDNKKFLSTLKKALQTLKDNSEAHKDLDRLLPRLARALEIVETERRQFTNSILTRIAGDVRRLYEAVHPLEGLNQISLELDPKRRASLDIGASFYGQTGAPPQAYFSESHLDTLGLCVFLALAALDDAERTILVLDDVLASVDEPHIERLIEMLCAEAMKFHHCIITTHYRPWKQKLRWGWLQNGQCHFVELAKWTTSSGLTLIRSIPDIDRLEMLLAETPPDPQLVCSKAGVILEAVLDFLTLLYECSVPRRADHRYTLGDLLPAIDKKLRKALRVEVLTGTDNDDKPVYETFNLTPILDELTRIAQARNIFGAHFNAISFEMLESDGIDFGQQVFRLVQLLTDAEAGWPRNKKSGSYWATAGETRRLHPLQKPA
mgnify:CR=1 FL=1